MPLFEGLNKDSKIKFQFLSEPVKTIKENTSINHYFVTSKELRARLQNETGMDSTIIDYWAGMSDEDIMLTLENMPRRDFFGLNDSRILFGKFSTPENRPEYFALVNNVSNLREIFDKITIPCRVFVRAGQYEVPTKCGLYAAVSIHSTSENTQLHRLIKKLTDGQIPKYEMTIEHPNKSTTNPRETDTIPVDVQKQLDDIVQRQLEELTSKIIHELLEHAKTNNVFDTEYKLATVKRNENVLKEALGKHLNPEKIVTKYHAGGGANLYYTF